MSARQAQKKGLNEQQKKNLVIAGFAVVALGVIAFNFSDSIFGTAPAPPPPPVIINKTPVKAKAGANTSTAKPTGFAVKGEAQQVGTTSQALDPTLHMESMLVTEALPYTGSGRNIFAAGPAAVNEVAKKEAPKTKIPEVIQPVRPQVAMAPAGPPPINLKFFGVASRANGDRRAFLLRGEDVFLASAGDIVDRRYKVISIAAKSIVIEDLPNSNQQTLPLQAN